MEDRKDFSDLFTEDLAQAARDGMMRGKNVDMRHARKVLRIARAIGHGAISEQSLAIAMREAQLPSYQNKARGVCG